MDNLVFQVYRQSPPVSPVYIFRQDIVDSGLPGLEDVMLIELGGDGAHMVLVTVGQFFEDISSMSVVVGMLGVGGWSGRSLTIVSGVTSGGS